MKILTLIVVLAATACAPPKAIPFSNKWEGKPNPLDEPGEGQPTAKDLHLGNLRAITQNPSYQAR